MRKLWAFILAFVIASGIAPRAQAVMAVQDLDQSRTALAAVHTDGTIVANSHGRQARPALSLSKLYLGYWVLYNGSDEHKEQVERMIRTSDDALAREMDAAYPQAINQIARNFDLTSTYRNGYWGKSRTSAVDIARFLMAISPDPKAAPIFRGMDYAAAVAADGTEQNFGTAQLPDVDGTKFAWSNDQSTTASASFGPGFTVAALSFGDFNANTNDALRGFGAAPAIGPVVSSLAPQL